MAALRIKSRTAGAGITARDWEPTAGAEAGYIVPDPLDPDIVYGGNCMTVISGRAGETLGRMAEPGDRCLAGQSDGIRG